jgi:hypothetical protein
MSEHPSRLIPIILFSLLIFSIVAIAEPQGPVITYNATEYGPVQPAAMINTSGGSFTTLVLNVSYQNQRWKAYAGNVTGRLTLQDSEGYSIYDWGLTTVGGQVYASRNDSVEWSSIGCAPSAIINNEQTILNHAASAADSINSTFSGIGHRAFYVGSSQITQNTCPSIATYINSTAQSLDENALFQQVLLSDSSALVYTTLLEDGKEGFNLRRYDFQMIVAESGISPTPTPYYFWVELS